jgi:hypothetical protein
MQESQHSEANKQGWVGRLSVLPGFHESYIETAFKCPEYTFEIEHTPLSDGNVAYSAHFTVHQFSPTIFKNIKSDWAEVRPKIDAPLLACGYDQDAKWIKFVEKLGFKYMKDVVGTDGSVRKLFVHY